MNNGLYGYQNGYQNGYLGGYGQQFGGNNPCSVYNNGYMYFTPANIGGQWVCVSN
jgi:hypothetical protein